MNSPTFWDQILDEQFEGDVMKSIQRVLFTGILVCLLSSSNTWADTTENYHQTIETVRYDIIHQVIKGYSSEDIVPSFFLNDWDESWIGTPLAYQPGNLIESIGLSEDQTAFLSGLTGLQTDTLYYIDLHDLIDPVILTNIGPITDANAVETGFSDYIDILLNREEEYITYTVDPLDPFNIIIDHYITTYVDEFFHSYEVIGAFNDLEEIAPNPVPEPATMLLSGLGLIGLASLRRRLNL